jgi:membrane protein YdbS with pleckstrin-like domain
VPTSVRSRHRLTKANIAQTLTTSSLLYRVPYNAAMNDDVAPTVLLHNVDPAAVSVWRVEAAITAVAVAVAIAVPVFPNSLSVAALLALIVLCLGLTVAWIWPSVRYRRLRYGLDEFGLILQHGVLWRAQVALPRTRIQHSDVSQGPLQRRFGISTLKLYTAGSRYTKIEVEGLQHEEALALRDSLLNRARPSG